MIPRSVQRIGLLRPVVLAVVLMSAGTATFALVARRLDGPTGPFPGGALHGQIWRGPEPDWGFASSLDTVEVEVNPESPRSGLTGVIVHGGALYIPTTLEPIKRWHKDVVKDGRVIVRINTRLFRRCATRVEDPKLLRTLIDAGHAKYGFPYHASWAAPFTWYWRLDPAEHCFVARGQQSAGDS